MADAPKIFVPVQEETTRRRPKHPENTATTVVLSIHNFAPRQLELFAHSRTTVHSVELKDFSSCLRFVFEFLQQHYFL